MAERFRVGTDLAEQPLNLEILLARGRALRNKTICDTFHNIFIRLRESLRRP